MLKNKIPYVYWIKNKTTGLKYVGVRFGKGCHPNELWVSYFTSSKSVHKLIYLYGKEDFIIKILHRYNNEEEAIIKEARYTQLAVKRKDYINFCSFMLANSTIQSTRGKLGGNIQKTLGLGIHKQTKEERLNILKNARDIQIKKELNQFINVSPEVQALRGKVGGAGNKGFVWINDGIKSFKYTKKDQYHVSLDEYLLKNPNIKKGRLK